MNTASLEDIYQPVEASLAGVPQIILDILATDNLLAGDVIRYFFSGKGKLLRPALTLLGAGMVQQDRTTSLGDGLGQQTKGLARPHRDVVRFSDAAQLTRVAASFEIFHAATLVHDDIIDSAYLRRNLPTIHTKWDAQTAVLVGDFLHDRAMGILFNDGSREIFALFLKTAGEVCDGEIHELFKKGNFTLTENEYLEIIRKKTSVLLACCLESGARFAGASEEEAKALYQYGIAFGNAFQIIDDCLDYTGNEHEFGKTLGADLEAGVLTLPLIRLLEIIPENERAEIEKLMAPGTNSNQDRFEGLLSKIKDSGSLDYACARAKEFCQKAKAELGIFGDSPAKESLFKLLDYVLERKK